MDNATKNKLMSGTKQADLTTGNACWETPPLVFEKLNRDFGPFDVDLTADAQRHLLPEWIGPGSFLHHDGLECAWNWTGSASFPRRMRGYSNPPYGPFVQKLLVKAKHEAKQGFTAALLLPMRATKAFHAHVLNGACELWFCDKRITFFENGVPRLNAKQWAKGRVVADPAVFDSIVVIFRPGSFVQPTVWCWQVPAHVTKADLELAADRKRQQERDAA